MFNTIGIPGLLIILGIVVLILGPKRLPAIGRSLGSSMREFKDSIARKSDEDDEDEEAERLAPPPDASTAPYTDASTAPYSQPREPAKTPVADGDAANQRRP